MSPFFFLFHLLLLLFLPRRMEEDVRRRSTAARAEVGRLRRVRVLLLLLLRLLLHFTSLRRRRRREEETVKERKALRFEMLNCRTVRQQQLQQQRQRWQQQRLHSENCTATMALPLRSAAPAQKTAMPAAPLTGAAMKAWLEGRPSHVRRREIRRRARRVSRHSARTKTKGSAPMDAPTLARCSSSIIEMRSETGDGATRSLWHSSPSGDAAVARKRRHTPTAFFARCAAVELATATVEKRKGCVAVSLRVKEPSRIADDCLSPMARAKNEVATRSALRAVGMQGVEGCL